MNQEEFSTRLQQVLSMADARADQLINKAESSDSSGDSLMYALGIRFVRDALISEFSELWPDDEQEVAK